MQAYRGNIYMVTAPSGAGKSSLIQALLKTDPNIQLSISCTTRQPRPGEEHGREYFFISESEFLSMIANKELLEWAKVHGNYYGTPKLPIEESITKGQDILLEIDGQGAAQVQQLLPQVISVFILPPSVDSLEQRLKNRAQDSENTIQRRVKAANQEILFASQCEYVIINDEFDRALTDLQHIVHASRLKYQKQYLSHIALFNAYGITL